MYKHRPVSILVRKSLVLMLILILKRNKIFDRSDNLVKGRILTIQEISIIDTA
jgi:hypothetical protein